LDPTAEVTGVGATGLPDFPAPVEFITGLLEDEPCCVTGFCRGRGVIEMLG